MSTTMPDFEMPAVVPPPPVDLAGAPRGDPPASIGTAVPGTGAATVVGATELTAEPEAMGPPPAAPRPRVAWRHVLAAALVGAVVGAGVPATVQAVDRAAAVAQVESLRALAYDYLTAIAERRADDASALVPVTEGPRAPALAPAAVLASARPIERQEVRLVHVDGDAAAIEVRYRAGGSDVFRTLDAERAEGHWRITTSLAETLNVYSMDDRSLLTIAGSSIESGRVLLYPGVYVPESSAGPVLVSRAESFVIDGDPGTPTEAYSSSELAPPLAELATAQAVASVAECQRGGACPEAEGAVLDGVDYVHVTFSDLEQGVVDLSVPLSSASPAAPWLEVHVRLTVDPDGQPLSWLCGRPGHYEADLAPCPTIG